MRKMGRLLAVAICALAATSLAGAAGTVSPPVQVTDDQFAANEESLGMDPSGQVMLGMWNDWHYNDGCGISYSTDGGPHWAPESFAPFTAFTNDPSVPGTGTFAIAGDPVVVYNPKSGLFDVICQAFGAPAHQIQLLSTTFDVTKANPTLTNSSYGLSAWRLPTVAITSGHFEREPERLEWEVPGPRSGHRRHGHRHRPPLRAAVCRRGPSSTARGGRRSTSRTRTTTERPGPARSA